MPTIGYGSNKKTRNLLPNYKLKFVVNNEKELDCLLMNNEKYCAEIGKNVGAVLRQKLLKKAKQLNVDVTNLKSKKIEKLEKKVKSANQV